MRRRRSYFDIFMVVAWSVIFGAFGVLCLLDTSAKDIGILILSAIVVAAHIWKITAGRGTR